MKKNFKLISLLAIVACPLLVTTLLAQSPSPYVISGTIRDGQGRGVPEASACAFAPKPGGGAICAKADTEGRFNLKLEKAGRYLLVPEKESDGYVAQYLFFYRAQTPSVTEIVISQDNARPFVSLLLTSKNGQLTGSTSDAATGLPVDNIKFTLCHASAPRVCKETNAKSAEGKFKVWAPHVPFTLRLTADGYEDWFGISGVDKEGAVYVASGTKLELQMHLKRRQETADKALSEAEKKAGVNLAAPLQTSPADNIELEHYPRVTKLEWSAVEGALSYSVEVDLCRGDVKDGRTCINPQPLQLTGNSPMSGLLETKYEFEFIGAQPGRWRVWAIDKDGREGFKSPWRTFIYLR